MDVYEVVVIGILLSGGVASLREMRLMMIARSRRIQKEVKIQDQRMKEIDIGQYIDNLPMILQNQKDLRNEMAKRNATDLQLKPLDDQIHTLETIMKYAQYFRPLAPLINPIVNQIPETVINLLRGLG